MPVFWFLVSEPRQIMYDQELVTILWPFVLFPEETHGLSYAKGARRISRCNGVPRKGAAIKTDSWKATWTKGKAELPSEELSKVNQKTNGQASTA
jgi:hypothetical protein